MFLKSRVEREVEIQSNFPPTQEPSGVWTKRAAMAEASSSASPQSESPVCHLKERPDALAEREAMRGVERAASAPEKPPKRQEREEKATPSGEESGMD